MHSRPQKLPTPLLFRKPPKASDKNPWSEKRRPRLFFAAHQRETPENHPTRRKLGTLRTGLGTLRTGLRTGFVKGNPENRIHEADTGRSVKEHSAEASPDAQGSPDSSFVLDKYGGSGSRYGGIPTWRRSPYGCGSELNRRGYAGFGHVSTYQGSIVVPGF